MARIGFLEDRFLPDAGEDFTRTIGPAQYDTSPREPLRAGMVAAWAQHPAHQGARSPPLNPAG